MVRGGAVKRRAALASWAARANLAHATLTRRADEPGRYFLFGSSVEVGGTEVAVGDAVAQDVDSGTEGAEPARPNTLGPTPVLQPHRPGFPQSTAPAPEHGPASHCHKPSAHGLAP
jgi:hypothetical protein